MIDEQLFDTAIEELIETHVRITNLEAITQALADELMAQDDYIDDLVAEYRHALDALENYEQEQEPRKPFSYEQWTKDNADALEELAADWTQTQEDARNAGNP